MNSEQKYVLSILRKSLNADDRTVDPSGIDAGLVAKMIRRNGILLTVFPSLPEEMQSSMKNVYFLSIKQAIQQEYLGEKVLQALNDTGFSCIALKGWDLRDLYPKKTMRQMADVDILVKPYDFDRIKTVMDGLGFVSEDESSWKHDSFKNGDVHIEMHKRLTDDSDAIRGWESGIWDRADTDERGYCRMSAEDAYIFHFVHMYKDFKNGSLGLRRIADTWLLQRGKIDTAYVKAHLDAFGMWVFHERMVRLSRVAMGEEPMDDDNEFLLLHAFHHGIYGSGKSYKAGRIASMGNNVRSGKIKSKMYAVFLPYSRMKAQFPILGKYPFLLPYCWLKRIIHFLRGDMKKTRSMLDYNDVNDEDYDEMKRFFEIGGI